MEDLVYIQLSDEELSLIKAALSHAENTCHFPDGEALSKERCKALRERLTSITDRKEV